MARRTTHKDVEYHVEDRQLSDARVFKSFDEAASFALVRAVSHGLPVTIDVVIWSPSGARFYGGDDAVSQYKDDPEASVFERISVKANSAGRIP